MTQQVTVFGANGRVGCLVVDELLRRHYDVVAFVHSSSNLPNNSHLSIVRGDIYDAEAVDQALIGSSAVISALGSWGATKKDILSVGMTHIISSMQQRGITKVVSLTGAEARIDSDPIGLIHRVAHVMLGIVAGKVLRDGEQHIALLTQSQLDWTVIRSPIMSIQKSELLGYTLTMKRPLPWSRIGRHFVVMAVVDALSDQTWQQKAPFIGKVPRK